MWNRIKNIGLMILGGISLILYYLLINKDNKAIDNEIEKTKDNIKESKERIKDKRKDFNKKLEESNRKMRDIELDIKETKEEYNKVKNDIEVQAKHVRRGEVTTIEKANEVISDFLSD